MNKPPSSSPDIRRREFIRNSALAAGAAAGGLWSLPVAAGGGGKPRVVVVGAGVFGGWTAMQLLEQGAEVVLLDAFGPGHSRSSSGGETRVIRGMYGPDALYVDWVLRSFELWHAAERRWGARLYTPTGALWMFRGDDEYAKSAVPLMAGRGLRVDTLTPAEAERRFPKVDFEGVRSIYYEHRAGFLAARDACRRLVESFSAAGGEYRLARAAPGMVDGGSLKSVRLGDGGEVEADAFVFACGPWLGTLFPDVLGAHLQPTRQEVYLFGTPAGETGFEPDNFPVWVDFGERIFYGIPGNHGRGFKIADDTRGEPADAESMQRVPSADGIERARGLLAKRFPQLADAPLLESRVCQYTNSPDGHLVVDRHPELDNVWLAGGGSGHGYKLGPALGEHVAGLVLGRAEVIQKFSLKRFTEALGS